MSLRQVLAIVLLVGGIVFIVMGVSASRSLVDQVSNFFTGRPTDTTLWYLVGGTVAAVAGLVMLVGRFGR